MILLECFQPLSLELQGQYARFSQLNVWHCLTWVSLFTIYSSFFMAWIYKSVLVKVVQDN